jgi:N-dimethylarginine dimethylaminohydrolase
MTVHRHEPRILMCAPDHFSVSYRINPWMDPSSWKSQGVVLEANAHREWLKLRETLAGLGAAIELVPPAAGQPDLVFTANAAVVMDRTALLARFRHPERRGEETPYARAFEALRARSVVDRVETLPEGIVHEGAGDCVWDRTRRLFWMGYGPRSDAAAAPVIARTFGVETVALELPDPRFYHMDTTLSPLPRGELMYFPGGFTKAGLAQIHARVAPELRLELGEEDAVTLAANAVCIGDAIVASAMSPALKPRLADRGYRPVITPLDSFRRSGGSAFCLTLRLDRVSAETVRPALPRRAKERRAGRAA